MLSYQETRSEPYATPRGSAGGSLQCNAPLQCHRQHPNIDCCCQCGNIPTSFRNRSEVGRKASEVKGTPTTNKKNAHSWYICSCCLTLVPPKCMGPLSLPGSAVNTCTRRLHEIMRLRPLPQTSSRRRSLAWKCCNQTLYWMVCKVKTSPSKLLAQTLQNFKAKCSINSTRSSQGLTLGRQVLSTDQS